MPAAPSGNTGRVTKSYLASLPFRIDIRPLGGHVSGPTIVLVHGNQTLNTVYVTEDRSDDFLAKMATGVGASVGDIICFGHTHKAWQRVVDSVRFVNAGSVGLPYEGVAAAFWLLLGPDVELRRTDYDVEGAVATMRAAGPPDIDEGMLADSLVNPTGADAVARIFEDRATGAADAEA